MCQNQIFSSGLSDFRMPKEYSGTGTKADKDNHANQCNPNNSEYRGYSKSYSGSGTKSDLDNHSNQMNSKSSAFHSSRGKKHFWLIFVCFVLEWNKRFHENTEFG